MLNDKSIITIIINLSPLYLVSIIGKPWPFIRHNIYNSVPIPDRCFWTHYDLWYIYWCLKNMMMSSKISGVMTYAMPALNSHWEIKLAELSTAEGSWMLPHHSCIARMLLGLILGNNSKNACKGTPEERANYTIAYRIPEEVIKMEINFINVSQPSKSP